MNDIITVLINLSFVLTNTGPTVVMRVYEGLVQGPPLQARARPSLTATTGGERDALIARPTIANVDAESIPLVARTFVSARLSTPPRPRLAFSLLATPAAVHSTGVCRPRRSPPPSFSASSSFGIARSYVSLHSAFPPTWHGSVVNPLGPFFFEGLVLPVSFQARHAFGVTPTVEGPHLLDAVEGRILSLPIQLLLNLISLGVPLFASLARSGRIHTPLPVTGRHTRRPRLATFGTDSLWSVDPWHDGLAVAVRCARGSVDSSPDSSSVHRLRFWLDIGGRPVGLLLGLALSVRA